MFISKLISTANKFSSLYQPANFYTSILHMYIIQTTYILMTFFSSKGKFSADASEVFIPDNAMLLPRKCNETQVGFWLTCVVFAFSNLHPFKAERKANVCFIMRFFLFYAVFTIFSPFINKRFVTKLKRFWAYLRCFRVFKPTLF